MRDGEKNGKKDKNELVVITMKWNGERLWKRVERKGRKEDIVIGTEL